MPVCAFAEFARNVLGLEGANSMEFEPTAKHLAVIDMPEISTTELGGTMRLGKRRTVFVRDCLMSLSRGGGGGGTGLES